MAMEPGPRQVFPSNINRISFGSSGGLLFLRAEQQFSGDPAFAEPAPKAFVFGLPASWGEFDMFALQVGKGDEKSKLGLVSITDPVNSQMLDKYLYWPHKPPVHVVGTKTITETGGGSGLLVLDKANFSPIVNHQIVFMTTTVVTRADALQQFIQNFTDLGLIPGSFSAEDVGLTVITNTGIELSQDEIIAIAPSLGWEYHFESDPSPPVTIKGVTDVAIVIMNLGKLYRDIPLGLDGKKPKDYKFFIRRAANPYGANVTFTWGVGASAWIAKAADTKKPKQRLSFPVGDGPGTYLVPTFPHPDNDNAQAGGSDDVEQEFKITITFGSLGIPPKVKIEVASGGS